VALPWLGCGTPHVTPEPTSSTGEPTAMSTSSGSTNTSADSSSTGGTAGGSEGVDSSGGTSESSEASQGESEAGTASTTVDMPVCGDAVVDPGEQCDLGFALNADEGACLSNCVLATCGDGFVRATAEECDDQNAVPTDGCHQCQRTRIVFITSEVYQGKDFMGLWGADQRCRSLAAQAGLANFAGFKAWLSDSKTAAGDRMYAGRGRYELVNGLLVAESWDALLAGELKHPINVTEKSETHENGVWTGTNPDGTIAEGSDHCFDWSSNDFKHSAYVGASSEASPSWTLIVSDLNPTSCGGGLPIYCFEQL